VPIYEYRCQKCDTKFEKLVRTMSDDQKPACPSCGSKQTQKSLSMFAVSSEGAARSAGRPSPCAGCRGNEGGTCPFE
jgi:putative FmdB family regulatory protein